MTPAPAHDATLVATVAGRPITVGHVRARVSAIRRTAPAGLLPAPGSPEARRLDRWVAQLLVTEAVVLHEARARGLRAGAPGRAARLLFAAVVDGLTVSEAQVRAYHATNADRYRRPASCRVRHILVADETVARDLVRRIAAGEDLVALASAHSLDVGSRARGGDLGDVARGTFAGTFEDAAFGAPVGRVVGPVRTEFGWHVLRVESRTPAGVHAIDAARPGIEADLLAAARGRVFDDWLRSRRVALAHVAPEWLPPGDPRTPDHVHRH